MGDDHRLTHERQTATPVRRTRRRTKIAVIGGAVALGVILLGAYGLTYYRYRMAIAYQMPCLGGAVFGYHQQYGVLPPSLSAIRDSGLYGIGATRLPGSVWEGWNDHSGPEALYLPVVDWDGKTEYVLAVQPPIGGSPRVYLVAGDTRAYRTTEEDLAQILARDDKLRAATSQPGRWCQVPWRASAGDAR